ncbi:hypothetical protein G6011_04223 [Alternaria panax]|uniref:Uncharacterized protein n=1 Tax=Alternaria panax TaxID=48097 RepID=A0AAD4IGU7_9PLEO|nr:hypothetical protein G6011_04223 [Alternaria panax]
MFPSALRSITKLRTVGRPSPSAISTQTRTLYFCGPKPGDHDPDLPIPQHYHARSRTTSSNEKPLATPTILIPPARPTTPTPTLRISVAYICSQLERHTMPSINKLETARKAFELLEAATHDDATTYNTAMVIAREIARLEVMLRQREAEGIDAQELQWLREAIRGLENLWHKMERKISRD